MTTELRTEHRQENSMDFNLRYEDRPRNKTHNRYYDPRHATTTSHSRVVCRLSSEKKTPHESMQKIPQTNIEDNRSLRF